ncbi:hypothetical protein [Myxococcus qinghaiensis]|uniref:hypothetical protein n=1 Tax=Myxococcus qinghaiensis TaxID=2906758 RepID=UPI0020A7773C|nr:hypothetical protein [Myxococcus qinghaiensis]MCP3169899.1 hypothetical protein [Myxococcus qinghaiensis]
MKRILNRLGLLALLCLWWTPVAQADVLDDVWRGTNVRLNAARIHVKGNDYATGYWLLPKASGTLNLNVPARDFGINSNVVLRMTGSRSGNILTWTFDETLSTPYYLGSANSVTRVRGTLKALARQVRGADDPFCAHSACPHNVELLLTSGSQVWVDGYTDIVFKFDWTEPVSVRQFVAYAGMPRPRLSSVRVLTSTNRCQSPDPTELVGEVTLSSAAPTGGALVELMSVDASVGVLNVRVPEAQRTARFAMRLPAGWSGPTVIQASSGGVNQTLRVALFRCVVVLFPFKAWLTLPASAIPRYLLNGGSVVARLANQESDSLITTKDTYALHEVLKANRVEVKGVSGSGDVFGTAYTSKGPSAFRLKASTVKSGAEVWVDGYEALLGNAHGTPLVRWPDDKDTVYLVDEVGPMKHQGLAGLASGRIFFNALGEAASTVATSKGARAVRIVGKESHVLVDQESEVTALNDVGMVLGTARTSDKKQRPFRWSQKDGAQWLPLPEGFVSAKAVSLNASGWAVGTATSEDGKTQAAFISTPDGKKSVALSQVAPVELTKAGYRFVEALAVSDDFEVLVRAVDGEGQTVHLVLRP